MAPHSKVTICRMARHAGIFHPRGAIVTHKCGDLTSSAGLDDSNPGSVHKTQSAPESIVVELSFESASWCDHSTSASPDSNGTGVLCHVRGIWRQVAEENCRDFSHAQRPRSTAYPPPTLTGVREVKRLRMRRTVASPQTDSVASDSAAMCVELCRQSARLMEIFSQDAY